MMGHSGGPEGPVSKRPQGILSGPIPTCPTLVQGLWPHLNLMM